MPDGRSAVSRSEMRYFVQARKEVKGLCGDVHWYVIQASPLIDADLARLQSGDWAKGPFPDGNSIAVGLAVDILLSYPTGPYNFLNEIVVI